MIAPAHAYAEFDWPVLPLEPGGKRPHGQLAPHGLHSASTDPATVLACWRRAPTANIGVRTGGGLVVLDVDDDVGADSLAALEREHGELPETVRAKTGGGGAHYYLSAKQRVPCSAGQLAPGLDVRGDGGYVVAPPSIHHSGRTYEWDVAPGEGSIAPLPDWLGRLLMPPGPRQAKPVAYWRQLVQGVKEGGRNDATARLFGYLLSRRAMDPHVALELVVAWDSQRNRPPLGRTEVTRTCESIARRELAKGNGCVRA